MPSFGEELRRERELREISLREIAEETKINVRYLEAMERNEFGELPGGVFNRGFVRAYCKAIGLDPESMVNAYLLEEQSRDAPMIVDEPMLRRGARAEPAVDRHSRARRPETTSPVARYRWVLLVLALIAALAALYAYFWWTEARRGFESTRAAEIVRAAEVIRRG